MKTYKEIIEGKEVVVTDSLVVAKEFGLNHKHLLTKIRKVIGFIAETELNLTVETSTVRFVESTYINSRGKTFPKIILTETGFHHTISKITHAKGKEAQLKLDTIKYEFVEEFARLRDQNLKLANLGRIFIEYFAPIDEIGMLSIFNGKLRLFTRRACLTTEKNARPFPVEDQKALIDGMSMVELRDISAKTIVRHAKNKKATNAKRYVPSFLYKYFDEKGWLANKVPYNPTLNLF